MSRLRCGQFPNIMLLLLHKVCAYVFEVRFKRNESLRNSVKDMFKRFAIMAEKNFDVSFLTALTLISHQTMKSTFCFLGVVGATFPLLLVLLDSFSTRLPLTSSTPPSFSYLLCLMSFVNFLLTSRSERAPRLSKDS